MYKRKIIIVVSIILTSLLIFYKFKKNEKISVVGNYESVSPSLYEKAKFAISSIECFYAGRKVKLLSDSTFIFIGDNNILTGQWHQEKDLINLHFLSNKYLSDSLLNKFGKPKVPLEDYFLKWNNPELYHFFTNSGDKCVEIFKINS